MTEDQIKSINKDLAMILNNQVILGNKLNRLQSDLNTVIQNQRIMASDQDELIEEVRRIKKRLNE